MRYEGECLLDAASDGVMMEWERPLMRAHAALLCGDNRDRDVLNVGAAPLFRKRGGGAAGGCMTMFCGLFPCAHMPVCFFHMLVCLAALRTGFGMGIVDSTQTAFEWSFSV